VWEALLEKMPYTALIRNLATMTRIELLTNRSRATKQVIKQLVDSQGLLLSRVHPVQVLSALLTYNKGQGQRGTGVWKPVPQVSAALDAAFYASFKNVEPTGRKLMLALDVSGSMRSPEIARCPGLTPRVASVAMALVLARVEKDCMFTAFMDKLTRLEFKPDTTLDEACKFIDRLQFGATDCSLPMQYAQAKKLDLDAFVILTDSETNAGSMHPTEALRKYRAAHDVPAKLVVVGMVSNGFTIADPNDAGMMDVVGFDTATPQIIEDFIR
jgi:60 kDa SS-A/Ro ribonucleoprotein